MPDKQGPNAGRQRRKSGGTAARGRPPAEPSGAQTRRARIVNRRGLHARAAAKFAKLAAQFNATVEVSRNDMTVTADSIMGLMMLAAAPGCEIELKASGREAMPAVEALSALVADGFGEDD